MKNLLAIVLVALLTACGGGESPAPTGTVPLPFRLASPVSGDTETVLHLYQALYGKAPSNPQLTTFKSQIAANGAVAWVNSQAAEFNNLSNRTFAERVLNNISITPNSLTATPTFGTSLQAYNALLGGFADYLTLVGIGNRGVVAAQLAKIISNLEVDTQFGVYGPAALSLNRQILVNSTYSADPKNLVDGIVPSATANAGPNQNVLVGSLVTLDGSSSTAEFGKTLTFSWTLTSRPAGSTAVLSNATSAKPTFTADAAGTYLASLVVNDGKVSSTAVTVSVTSATLAPMVSIFTGNGTRGFVNGSGTAASFSDPKGIVVDSIGNFYVSEVGNNAIRKITPAGVVTTFAGNGFAGFTNSIGMEASFQTPQGLAVDRSGNVFVADQHNYAIRKITPAGVVSTFAGGSFGFTNGIGVAASFANPHGVAFDSTGNLYVADSVNHSIRKITPAGAVTTFAGNGSLGFTNGEGTAASFNYPRGIAFDSSGNLLVVDQNNNAIRKITPDGMVSTFAGNGTRGRMNGSGTSASFEFPQDIAFDSSGNVFVTDTGNNLIRKISPAGVVSTFLGFDSFANLMGLTIDRNGNLYVVRQTSHDIIKIVP